jgi:hypothetical protein
MRIGPLSLSLFEDWLGTGLGATLAAIVSVFAFVVVLYVVLRRGLLPLIGRLARRTAFRWDDVLAERKLQRWLALLLPAVLVHLAVPLIARNDR